LAANAGLQVEFTTVIHEARLAWAVTIRTDRGDLIGTSKGNTERHWIECLHTSG
jgi:hypothetical protein